MLSPQSAAKKAKVSRKTIMNHILSMKLPATRNNENNWVIRPTDLANWMSERNPERYPSITATSIPVSMRDSTSQHEISLLKATMLLEHTQKELLITKADQARLRSEISEMKMEIKGSRKDMVEMTKIISQMAMTMTLQSNQPSKTSSKRFLLTPEMRIEADSNKRFLLTPEMRIEADSNKVSNIFTD